MIRIRLFGGSFLVRSFLVRRTPERWADARIETTPSGVNRLDFPGAFTTAATPEPPSGSPVVDRCTHEGWAPGRECPECHALMSPDWPELERQGRV